MKRQEPQKAGETCEHCNRPIGVQERALFVEEEIGRVFCSEPCIAQFFQPQIERLEKEYERRLTAGDLRGSEREALDHLRWITLQEPDEIWREKTLSGDLRYTLISEFQPGERRVWCVCVCLFLRGEPSFLFIAFPTRNAAMVNQYRRGERVAVERPARQQESPRSAAEGAGTPSEATPGQQGEAQGQESSPLSDRLGEPWTEEETIRARMLRDRRSDDVPAEEFALYQGCMEETLESPDEVWTLPVAESGDSEHDPEASFLIYHFIKYYAEERPPIWYVIVARETEGEEHLEIVDVFPTRDPTLVERYRRGEQEVGEEDTLPGTTRLIH